MSCLFAVFEICHRSHRPLCSLFQIPKPTKIQGKTAQFILSPLLKIGILKISGSALAAEICIGPHNRLLRGIAPERGSYSRIGACPYLSPQLINSRFCPCKGLISRTLLRGKPRQRYAPLTGAEARIDELRREIGASPYPGI